MYLSITVARKCLCRPIRLAGITELVIAFHMRKNERFELFRVANTVYDNTVYRRNTDKIRIEYSAPERRFHVYAQNIIDRRVERFCIEHARFANDTFIRQHKFGMRKHDRFFNRDNERNQEQPTEQDTAHPSPEQRPTASSCLFNDQLVRVQIIFYVFSHNFRLRKYIYVSIVSQNKRNVNIFFHIFPFFFTIGALSSQKSYTAEEKAPTPPLHWKEYATP